MKDVLFVKKSKNKKGYKRKPKIKSDKFDVFYYREKRKGESERDYARSIYRQNKEFFQREFTGRAEGAPRTFKAFYEEYKARKTLFGNADSEAVLNSIRSKYMSGAEVWRANAIKALKSTGHWKEFRELTKERGRYTSFDISKLSYNEGAEYFIYDGKVAFGFFYEKGVGLRFDMRAL